MAKLTPPAKFWAGLAAYVLVADVILWRTEKDTMSIQFGKWLETRKGRLACAAVWGGLTAHLFWKLPIPGQNGLKKIATYKHNGNGKKVLETWKQSV